MKPSGASVTRAIKRVASLGPVLDIPLPLLKYIYLDLSHNNPHLGEIDPTDPKQLDSLVSKQMAAAGADFAIGRYSEERVIYNSSFGSRAVHLGVDICGVPAGMGVRAPIAGTIHSAAFHPQAGDYGGTVLLRHQLEERRGGSVPFYTLWGHLARKSLEGLRRGMQVPTGSRFASLGTHQENGQYPVHLHLQLITDLAGHENTFPGVCDVAERRRFLSVCPDPMALLRIGKHTR